MKKFIISSFLAYSVLHAGNAPYEFSLMGGGSIPEGELKLDNYNHIGARLGIANTTDTLSSAIDMVELSVEKSNGAEYENSTLETDVTRVSVDALHHYDAIGENLVPYALAGIGAESYSDPMGDVNSGPVANIGAGLKYMVSDSFYLRAEIRDAINFIDDLEHTLVYNVGFTIPFGETSAKPAPEPEPMPEPKPAPKPVVKADIDSDKDGIYDRADSCPNTPAGVKVDQKGCMYDIDRDGVADELDQCVNTPRDVKVDATGCELDTDRDGVGNSKDQCPRTPMDAEVGTNGCELDSDNDGVVNGLDRCQDSKAGAIVDNNGCEVISEEVKFDFEITFDTNSNVVKDAFKARLNLFADLMKKHPELKVEVQGHTDSLGSRAYNQALSERRALAVKNYLVNQGVEGTRLTSKGYGPDQPIASNATKAGRHANRRVEAKIIK
jgi:OOP family OmpA-OmpF porin